MPSALLPGHTSQIRGFLQARLRGAPSWMLRWQAAEMQFIAKILEQRPGWNGMSAITFCLSRLYEPAHHQRERLQLPQCPYSESKRQCCRIPYELSR